MRKRIGCLALLCALWLTGCSALLDRPYVVVNPHPEHPATGEDSSTIKVKSYQELVNAVLYFVSQGLEHGVVKLVDYTRDAEQDLNAACLEVAKDDPLGAYAVDFIKHDYTRVLTSYEANIYITFRRTTEQLRSIVNVTGSSAIRKELAGALSSFRTEAVLRVGYFTEDEAYLSALVRQAYYDAPAAAFGMPEVSVALYPDQGSQRIVEIILTYPDAPAVLQKKSEALQESAQALAAPLQLPQYTAREKQVKLSELLPTALTYHTGLRADGTAPNTAWDALLGQGADSEGMALAYKLLCSLLEIDCAVTEGQVNGQTHYWNTLSLGTSEERYVDLTLDSSGRSFSGEELATVGYVWSSGSDVPTTNSAEISVEPENTP